MSFADTVAALGKARTEYDAVVFKLTKQLIDEVKDRIFIDQRVQEVSWVLQRTGSVGTTVLSLESFMVSIQLNPSIARGYLLGDFPSDQSWGTNAREAHAALSMVTNQLELLFGSNQRVTLTRNGNKTEAF